MFDAFLRKREMNRWLTALAVTACLLCIAYLCCYPAFETNDDNAIIAAASGATTGSPYAGNGFTTYLYGALLAGLYSLCAYIPWHTLILLGMIGVSLAAILKSLFCLCRRYQLPMLFGLGLLIGLFAGVLLPYVVKLQFTAVPAFAATAAACLVLTLPTEARKAAKNFSLAVAGVLLLLSFGIRSASFLLTLPLLIGLGLVYWLQKKQGRRMVAVFCAATLALTAGLTLLDNALYRTHEANWAEYKEYNDRLGDLLDYNNTDLMQEIAPGATGWSMELTVMTRGWYLLDSRLNIESLNALMGELDAVKPTLTAYSVAKATGSLLLRYPMFGFNLLGAAMVSLFAFIHYAKRRQFWAMVGIAGTWAYLLLAVAYFYGILGRMPERVAFAAACPFYVLLVVACLPAFEKKMREPQRGRILAAVCGAVVLCGAATLVLHGERLLPLRWQPSQRPVQFAMTQSVNAYVAKHSDLLYITDITQRFSPFYIYEKTLPVNLIDWSNCMLRSDMFDQKMERLGLPAPDTTTLFLPQTRLLVSSPHMLDGLLDYIDADYGPVEAELVEDSGSFVVYRLSLVP